MILSVSRRTDIPAFYLDWFINRLREGFVYVRNPINKKNVSRIDLGPKGVEAIVFWTKDATKILPYLDEMEGLGYKNYCFQYTITNYGKDIETNLSQKDKIIENFIYLSKRIGKEKMIWRYDPILIKGRYDVDFHKRSFQFLCQRLSPYCAKVAISFIDIYPKIKGIFDQVSSEDQKCLIQSLYKIAENNNIEIQSCCEKDLGLGLIQPSACIGSDLIEKVTQTRVKNIKDKGQRKSCMCLESIDIGSYNICKNGCLYCYAKNDGNGCKIYDPKSPILCDQIKQDDRIRQRPIKNITDGQLSFL